MAYGKTKKWMIGGAALAGTAVLTAALWQGLTLRRYALHTDKLSAPVRLLLLTDLHSTFYGRAQRGLLSAIQAQTPDAVLLAGDMADDSRGDAGVDALMSALGGACPCCYVSGNHEVRTGCLEALKRRFRSWGITVLEGSGTLLATPGGTLRICGSASAQPFFLLVVKLVGLILGLAGEAQAQAAVGAGSAGWTTPPPLPASRGGWSSSGPARR